MASRCSAEAFGMDLQIVSNRGSAIEVLPVRPTTVIIVLLLIIILALLFAGGGGYYGYSRWGPGGGLGIVGTVVVIILVLYLLGMVR
jgi:hypothetical protein